jgi:hypothetical protein
MTHAARPLVLASLLLALAGAPALAQPFLAGDPPLSGRQVLDILSRRGFEPITGARFNGDAYVVDAISPRGEAVRLVIDAFDGQVIRRVNLEGGSLDTRGYEPPPPWVRRYERPEAEMEEEPRPAPRPARPAPTARVEPPAAPRPAPPAEPPVATVERPAPAPAPRPTVRTVPPAPAPTPTPTVKAPDPQPQRPAASATPQGPRTGAVRVIDGVTPVLPRSQRGVDEVGVPVPETPGELRLD